MKLRLPRPLHGWREFGGEVGIIVLGVLIALGAQQIVESLHERYLARQAEKHIRAELAYDSAFAAERVAIGDCLRASFTDLRQRLLVRGDDWPGLENAALTGTGKTSEAAPFFASPPPMSSPHRLWPMSAWTAATTSSALSDSREHFFSYAALYAMVEWLGRLQDHEISDDSKLMPLGLPQKLDPSARLQLFRDVGTVDADNADIERLAAVFVTAARHNGIPPDPRWLRRVLGPDAGQRGACVKRGAALNAALDREFTAALLQ
jgi:hypothetical protein